MKYCVIRDHQEEFNMILKVWREEGDKVWISHLNGDRVWEYLGLNEQNILRRHVRFVKL